jgi:hypothetical protein
MFRCQSEPTLHELLSDPLVRMVMAADHVDGRQLQALASDVMQQREAHGGSQIS